MRPYRAAFVLERILLRWYYHFTFVTFLNQNGYINSPFFLVRRIKRSIYFKGKFRAIFWLQIFFNRSE